ncbi:MAG: type VI secretion system baseplate subunit TssE [Acidobacteria bacterium]|nr:type VI secretion system baseplate subunit TssE [Acidobacteriota bacterium]
MASFANERLQPSLLDRLTDDEPRSRRDPAEARFISVDGYRESVVRDLAWLLNANNLESTIELGEYPAVARSVVNFGVREIVGMTASGIDLGAIEKMLREVIAVFEPRLIPGTVVVKAVRDPASMAHNAVAFTIEAQLWSIPTPIRLVLRSELDLESGLSKVADVTEE